MITYDQWSVVLTRFPFAERAREKLRPVVVLSSNEYTIACGLVIVAMVTSARSGGWTSDTRIEDLASVGLRQPCVVRWKLATLSAALVDRQLGAISASERGRLRRGFSAVIPFDQI